MVGKTFLILNNSEQLALCYIKNIDGYFADCDSIFCSDAEVTLSFNDRFHLGAMKEVPEEDKEKIKEILNSKTGLLKETIEKFCENYGKKDEGIV